MEAFWGMGKMAFDGRVLEVFDITIEGSKRYDIELIGGLGFDKGLTGTRVKMVMRGMSGTKLKIEDKKMGNQLLFGFSDEQQPALEELIQEIWKARGVA